MLRLLLTVVVSALAGSLIGTIIFVAVAGGTGTPDPMSFVAGMTSGTMLFTVPGAMLLMYLAITFADRGLRWAEASLLLLLVGPAAGACMLFFTTPCMMAIGGLFGFVTAAAFVGALRVFRIYPVHTL